MASSSTASTSPPASRDSSAPSLWPTSRSFFPRASGSARAARRAALRSPTWASREMSSFGSFEPMNRLS